MSDTIEKVKCLIIGSGPAGYTAASAICTETGMYDGVASLLNDNSHAEQEDLLDLFKDPSGSFGLSGSPITNNTDYNFSDLYLGFHYRFKTGIFTFNPGVSAHTYSIKNTQFGM